MESNVIKRLFLTILLAFALLDLNDFNLFKSKVKKNVLVNTTHTVSIKLRYEDSFIMLGSQFGFLYRNDKDLLDLIDIILMKLNESLNRYGFSEEDILYIQLAFRPLDAKIISDLGRKEDFENIKTKMKTSNIPMSINEDTLGSSLNTHNSNGYITKIDYTEKGVTLDFLKLIRSKSKLLRENHPDKIDSFDSSYKFYLVKSDNLSYILAISDIGQFVIRKIRFSLNGVVLANITDSLMEGNIIQRVHGKNVFYILDNKVLYKRHEMKFLPLKKRIVEDKFIDKPNIGAIDIETYTEVDDSIKIFSLGFKTNLAIEPTIYYVESKDNINSEEIVLNFVKELLKDKYKNITFYSHNFGGYDAIFIVNTLLNYNDIISDNPDNNENLFKLSFVFRDDRILKLTISKMIKGTQRSFTIQDSLAMLPSSLDKVAKDLNVDTLKGIFPHKFSKRENLFYIGSTPDISYYKDISVEDYKTLKSNNWSFKDVAIQYLKRDLICLYEVVCTANKQLFFDYKIDMLNNLSVSGLALSLFLSEYYNKNIPTIKKKSIYDDIQKAYYGGITEVYKPYGENLYYYDVNSLYPYVALNDMPGLECYYEEYFDINSSIPALNIDDKFGFYFCEVVAPKNSYLGLLPVKNDGGLYFPLGSWSGWYFSEELKFAKLNGYLIKVIKGYSFNRESNVFNSYVDKLYNIKFNAISSTQKSMAKNLLNNLLGRFGIRLDKAISRVVKTKTYDIIAATKKVVSFREIGGDRVLVSYINKLDADIIKSHNLNLIKVINTEPDHESQSVSECSVVISAAVTAYGRIFMSNIKLQILKNAGNIYYSDTDSLVTDKPLDEKYIF